MKKNVVFSLIFLTFVVALCFRQIVTGKIPVPSDSLVGLYHPFRDALARDYPRGLPFKNPIITDPVLQQIPWRELAVSSLKKFELPLWNPYVMGGTPLLGNIQSASLYPLNVLFFLLPFVTAWSLLIVLQPLLAGIFMYFYLRNLKMSDLSAVFGSITFSFSGFFLSFMEWGIVTHTGLWLPLILLSIDRILTTKKQKIWILFFVTGLLCSFLAGHLQTFAYVALVSLSYLLFRLRENGWKSFFPFVISLAAFLFLVLPVLNAQLQFILLSARDVDLTFEKPGFFIPLRHLMQFLAPDFFGNPATGNYFGVWNYGEFLGYVGIFPLLFAVLGIAKKHKISLFYLGVLILSLVFAIDSLPAKIPYIVNIPFLASTQPTRLLFVVGFALSVLAAFGMERLVTSKKSLALRPIIFTVLSLVLFVVTLVFHSQFGINDSNWAVSRRNLILPTLLLFMSLIFFVANRLFHNKTFRRLMLIGVIVITVIDLLFIANKYNAFTDTRYFYPSTKTLTFLKSNIGNGRLMAVDRRILPPNASVWYRLQSVSGYDPLYLKRYGELIAATGRRKPDISTPFGFERIITPEKYDSKISDLLGVKYVLSLTDITHPKLTIVFVEGETKIYENTDAFARVFFVEKIIPVKSKQDAISRMFDEAVDLKKMAVVELEGESLPNDTFSIGEALITEYSENFVEVTTRNKAEGFLVLTDSYYPSWKVTLDGNPWSMIRTDYHFRGVIVPQGTHTIQFRSSLF